MAEVSRQRNEAQAAAPRWISVAERLPEDGKEVLVWAKRWRFAELERGKWIDWTVRSYLKEVTHWQPLSEPPKEGA